MHKYNFKNITPEVLEFLRGREKPFYIDTIRRLFLMYEREEISLSKVVEELNIISFEWKKENFGE